jgi:hypothetical protein
MPNNKRKTAQNARQKALDAALRANLARRKAQARARAAAGPKSAQEAEKAGHPNASERCSGSE